MIKTSEFLDIIGQSKGFSRSNHFQVELFPPESVTLSNTALKNICINCNSAVFPGRTLDSNAFILGGMVARNMPISASYAPLPLAFYLSQDHRERTLFEKWQEAIYNESTNTLGFYDDYVGSAYVSQLNRKKEVVKKYQLFEVWPSAINEISIAQSAENTVSELGVSLFYRNYKEIL